MTTYHTDTMTNLPAPSDTELMAADGRRRAASFAEQVEAVLQVRPTCPTCDGLGYLPETYEDGSAAWCTDCRRGCEIGLRYYTRKLTEYADTLATLDAKKRARGLTTWEEDWRAQIDDVYHGVLMAHDALEAKWESLA